MSASFKSLVRIASAPFDQEKYIYFAGPVVFVGLMLLASGAMPKTGACLFALGLGWHLTFDWGRN